jgi:hypothetical protein
MKFIHIINLKFSTLFLFLIIPGNICCASENVESKIVVEIDSSLQYIIQMQKEIKNIHPFLDMFHPIALAENSDLYIFDFDSSSRKYIYIKKTPIPFPMPKILRASFPLSSYNSEPSCVLTRDVFDSKNGYVTIFHEFIHCSQYQICERKLKQTLIIAEEASKRNDYTWEISHPFPYEDSLFINDYSQFIEAINNDYDEAILEHRRKLRHHLKQIDFEYMVWQEWKEGFARLIENKILSVLLMEENHAGREKPYNRLTFYYGGSKFINYLIEKEPRLYINIELLYDRMINF